MNWNVTLGKSRLSKNVWRHKMCDVIYRRPRQCILRTRCHFILKRCARSCWHLTSAEMKKYFQGKTDFLLCTTKKMNCEQIFIWVITHKWRHILRHFFLPFSSFKWSVCFVLSPTHTLTHAHTHTQASMNVQKFLCVPHPSPSSH